MGFMDKLKAGAEEVKVGAKETTARARDTVHEAQVRHDLAQAYTELGHTTYTLIDEGSLHVLSAAEFGCWRTPKPRPSEAERVALPGGLGQQFSATVTDSADASAHASKRSPKPAPMLWCLGDAVDGPPARPPHLTVACVKAINDVCTVKLAGNH